MSELKSCPFCGGEAETRLDGDWWVVCPNCTCEIGLIGMDENGCHGHYPTEAGAIAAWNTRHAETCRMIYDEEASGDELYPTEEYHCSECGKWVYAGKPNYCPSCGRKVERCDRECPSETPSMPRMSELFGILRDSEKREDT